MTSLKSDQSGLDYRLASSDRSSALGGDILLSLLTNLRRCCKLILSQFLLLPSFINDGRLRNLDLALCLSSGNIRALSSLVILSGPAAPSIYSIPFFPAPRSRGVGPITCTAQDSFFSSSSSNQPSVCPSDLLPPRPAAAALAATSIAARGPPSPHLVLHSVQHGSTVLHYRQTLKPRLPVSAVRLSVCLLSLLPTDTRRVAW